MTESDVCGCLLFKNSKLVVPTKMREEILEKLHEAHMGMKVKCKEQARDILFWPGIAKQIEVVQKCAVRNKHKDNSSRETLNLKLEPIFSISTTQSTSCVSTTTQSTQRF